MNTREKILDEVYGNTEPFHKKFIAMRSNRKGFDIVERLVDKDGLVMDFGCGHGYFCYYLSYKSNKRRIIGIDIDDEKIKVAKRCNNNKDNIVFITGDINDARLHDVDTVVVIDVLYQLPDHEKKNVIKNIYDSLKEGGKIILREEERDNRVRFKYLLEDLREFFVISFWRKRLSYRLYFPKENYYKRVLGEQGFKNIIQKNGCHIGVKKDG